MEKHKEGESLEINTAKRIDTIEEVKNESGSSTQTELVHEYYQFQQLQLTKKQTGPSQQVFLEQQPLINIARLFQFKYVQPKKSGDISHDVILLTVLLLGGELQLLQIIDYVNQHFNIKEHLKFYVSICEMIKELGNPKPNLFKKSEYSMEDIEKLLPDDVLQFDGLDFTKLGDFQSSFWDNKNPSMTFNALKNDDNYKRDSENKALLDLFNTDVPFDQYNNYFKAIKVSQEGKMIMITRKDGYKLDRLRQAMQSPTIFSSPGYSSAYDQDEYKGSSAKSSGNKAFRKVQFDKNNQMQTHKINPMDIGAIQDLDTSSHLNQIGVESNYDSIVQYQEEYDKNVERNLPPLTQNQKWKDDSDDQDDTDNKQRISEMKKRNKSKQRSSKMGQSSSKTTKNNSSKPNDNVDQIEQMQYIDDKTLPNNGDQIIKQIEQVLKQGSNIEIQDASFDEKKQFNFINDNKINISQSDQIDLFNFTNLEANQYNDALIKDKAIMKKPSFDRKIIESYKLNEVYQYQQDVIKYLNQYILEGKKQLKCEDISILLKQFRDEASKVIGEPLTIKFIPHLDVEYDRLQSDIKHLKNVIKADKVQKQGKHVTKNLTQKEQDQLGDLANVDAQQKNKLIGGDKYAKMFKGIDLHGKPYVQSDCMYPKFDSVFKLESKTARESGILYRYPIDQQYNKYNYITVRLNRISVAEIAIMGEMVKNMIYILTESIQDQNNLVSTGTPYFFQGNYRLMYFPHKYLRDQHRNKDFILKGVPYNHPKKLAFQCYQNKNLGMFNSFVIFKKEKRQNYNTYYLYEDELMNVANILMDGIIYNDRRSFLALITSLYPPLKLMVLNQKMMTPEYFPFTQVMNLILFNRHMNNYNVECFYDSNVDSKDYVGEQFPDTIEIINENIDKFKPILEKGSMIVEFSYTFSHLLNPQVHFVVIRLAKNGELQMQSSKTLCVNLPRYYIDGYSLARRQKFLKDELFYETKDSKRSLIDIYRVRFYSCQRLKKLPVSKISGEKLIYHYNIRNRLVLFFSMYSLFDYQQMLDDLKRGAPYVASITALLDDNYVRDDDSNSVDSDDHENDQEMMLGIEDLNTEFISEESLEAAVQEYIDGSDISLSSKLIQLNTFIGKLQEILIDMDLFQSVDQFDFLYSYTQFILQLQNFVNEKYVGEFLTNSRDIFQVISKVFHQKIKGRNYLNMQISSRILDIEAMCDPVNMQIPNKVNYYISYDICYWIAEDRYIDHNINLYNGNVYKYYRVDSNFAPMMFHIRNSCDMQLNQIRKLLALNYVHYKTGQNYRSKYVAPRISLIEKQKHFGYWHGYGYYKTDWKWLNRISLQYNPNFYQESKEVRNQRSNSKKKRESRRHSMRESSRDEEDLKLKKAIYIKANDNASVEGMEVINQFELVFYDSITELYLLQTKQKIMQNVFKNSQHQAKNLKAQLGSNQPAKVQSRSNKHKDSNANTNQKSRSSPPLNVKRGRQSFGAQEEPIDDDNEDDFDDEQNQPNPSNDQPQGQGIQPGQLICVGNNFFLISNETNQAYYCSNLPEHVKQTAKSYQQQSNIDPVQQVNNPLPRKVNNPILKQTNNVGKDLQQKTQDNQTPSKGQNIQQQKGQSSSNSQKSTPIMSKSDNSSDTKKRELKIQDKQQSRKSQQVQSSQPQLDEKIDDEQDEEDSQDYNDDKSSEESKMSDTEQIIQQQPLQKKPANKQSGKQLKKLNLPQNQTTYSRGLSANRGTVNNRLFGTIMFKGVPISKKRKETI